MASLTVVKHNAVMVSRGRRIPCAPPSTATAPCTGPPTSLFRQFAPESPLPSPGFLIYPPNRPQNGNGRGGFHSMANNEALWLDFGPQNEWGIRHFHSMANRRQGLASVIPSPLQRAVPKARGGFGGCAPVEKGAARLPPTIKKAPGVVRHSGLKVGGNLLSHLV